MKDFMRQDLAAIKAAQPVYNTEHTRDIWIIVAVLLVTVALVSFSMGRQTMLSDLSQQRARDVSLAIVQKCDEKFVTPLEEAKVGQPLILQASTRCSAIWDTAREEIYAAGVSPIDEVMERAKQMAREAEKR